MGASASVISQQLTNEVNAKLESKCTHLDNHVKQGLYIKSVKDDGGCTINVTNLAAQTLTCDASTANSAILSTLSSADNTVKQNLGFSYADTQTKNKNLLSEYLDTACSGQNSDSQVINFGSISCADAGVINVLNNVDQTTQCRLTAAANAVASAQASTKNSVGSSLTGILVAIAVIVIAIVVIAIIVMIVRAQRASQQQALITSSLAAPRASQTALPPSVTNLGAAAAPRASTGGRGRMPLSSILSDPKPRRFYGRLQREY
jgi:hypothetical protein